MKKGMALNDMIVWIVIFLAILAVGLVIIMMTESPLRAAVEGLFGGWG